MATTPFVNLHDGVDVIGLIGLALFFLAVWRISIKRSVGKPIWYELDVAGSVVCLVIYSYSKGAFLGIITTIVWGLWPFAASSPTRSAGAATKPAGGNHVGHIGLCRLDTDAQSPGEIRADEPEDEAWITIYMKLMIPAQDVRFVGARSRAQFEPEGRYH